MDKHTQERIDRIVDGNGPFYNWSLVTQGSCTEVRCKATIPQTTRPPIRGSIRKFSGPARMRMLRACAKINWQLTLPALFITLTTPDSVADCSPDERTTQREAFRRRLESHIGRKVPILWRIEWQKRRSGKLKGKLVHHFHLIVCNVQYIHWRLIRKWWALSIGSKGILKTWVERIGSPLMCASYLCKYMSKIPSLDYAPYLNKDESIGRQWGIFRTSLVPRFVRQNVFYLWEEDVEFLSTIASEKIRDFGKYGPMSFTLFGDDVREGLEIYFETRLEPDKETS